ncbi:MAG: ABC transporter permease [Vicinamibacterales bacterium]
MGTVIGDLRYALRAWRRQPLLTLVALFTLTLGIGANTAIFSIIKAVLLNELQYPDPQLLLVLWERDPKGASVQVSNPNYLDWRDRAKTLQSLGAFKSVRYAFKGREEPIDVAGVRATVDLFDVLGVRPVMGRGFQPEDSTPGRDKVALVSDGFWRRQLGGDPAVIGRVIELDAQRYDIVGVMPSDFGFPPGQPVNVWTPLTFNNADAHDSSRGSRGLNVVGRLAAQATAAQAEQELASIADALASQYPETNKGWSVRLVPAREQLVESVRPALLVVLGGVIFLLLLVCVNVANLMLARLAGRRREMAVRRSLGAERRQLIRQVLVESVVLSLVGGGLGLLVAWLGLHSLDALPPGSLPRMEDVRVDVGVLGFTVGASVLAAVVFGLLPALVSSRADVRDDLQATSGAISGSASQRLLGALVVAEVAIALVLLVGAGLLTRSFSRLLQVSPGFVSDHVVTAQLYLPRAKYGRNADQARFFDELLAALRASPGVVAAGATSALPLNPVGIDFALPFTIDGRMPPADEVEPHADIRIVTSGYAEALRIPLLKGRLIDERDTATSPHVMLINETLARRYFGSEDPIGKFITNPHGRAEVVGVVGDVHHYGLDANPRAEVYMTFSQNVIYAMGVVVRATSDVGSTMSLVRSTVGRLDPAQPIRDLSSLDGVVARSVFLPRFSMLLVDAFAIAALLLAAVGIYGVLSYSVSQQTKDIGVRMALGAESGDTVRLVLRRSLTLVALGGVVGLIVALPTARVMRGVLFGAESLDPVVFLGVLALLTLVAVAAALLPAIRATRVDPLIALRTD